MFARTSHRHTWSELDNRTVVDVSAMPRRKPRATIHRETMDDTTGWSTDGRGALSYDTEHYLSIGANARSIKLTKTTEADTYCKATRDYGAGTEVDLRDGSGNAPLCRVRFYIDPAVIAKVSDVSIWVATDWSNYKYRSLSGRYESGWFTAAFDLHNAAGAGSIDWEHVRYVRIQLDAPTAADLPYITVDSIEFYAKRAKGIYCLTLDDGLASQYDLLGYAADRGVYCTLGVPTASMGTGGSYMSVAQLHVLRDAGHLIANHGHRHLWPGGRGVPVGSGPYVDDYIRAYEWLMRNGFGDGARIFVLPGGGGSWKRDEIQWDYRTLFLGSYADAVRTTGEIVWCSDVRDTNVISTGPFDSVANAGTALAQAAAAGSVCCVGLHAVTDLAAWKAHIDDVVTARDDAGTIETATLADLWSK